MSIPIYEVRARQYSELFGITIDFAKPLGHGNDGQVWKTNQLTAVKVLERERKYALELECYRRIADAGVNRIGGFAVPKLMGFSDEHWGVEMEIVSPPYVIDFAKVWLDDPPDFDAEVLEDADRKGSELFERKWPEVRTLLWTLQNRFGIYYTDPNAGNITFRDWKPSL